MLAELELCLEAVGADAVADPSPEGLSDALPPAANFIQVQPFVADLEPVAPGAAAKNYPSDAGCAQDPREVADTPRLGL